MKDNLYTLHSDFELSNEWLIEVIKKGSLGNDLLQEVNNFLDLPNFEDITESDIDEVIKESLEYLDYQYNMGDFSNEVYLKNKAEVNDRESVKKELELNYIFTYIDALASGEYLVALSGYPTAVFNRFIRDNSIENKFWDLTCIAPSLFKKSLNDILCNIIPAVKKENTLNYLGIFGKENKNSWLKSIDDLEYNINLSLSKEND